MYFFSKNHKVACGCMNIDFPAVAIFRPFILYKAHDEMGQTQPHKIDTSSLLQSTFEEANKQSLTCNQAIEVQHRNILTASEAIET